MLGALPAPPLPQTSYRDGRAVAPAELPADVLAHLPVRLEEGIHRNDATLTARPRRLETFGYDAASQVLAVQFKGGAKVHEFPDVDAELADKFIKADSKRKAFHAHIRGREFTKTDAEAADEIYEGSTPD